MMGSPLSFRVVALKPLYDVDQRIHADDAAMAAAFSRDQR